MPNYIENKPIYHINGDKYDNHIDNLTYNRKQSYAKITKLYSPINIIFTKI